MLVLAVAEVEGDAAEVKGTAAKLLELNVEGLLFAKLVAVFSIVTMVTMIKVVSIQIPMAFRSRSHKSRLR